MSQLTIKQLLQYIEASQYLNEDSPVVLGTLAGQMDADSMGVAATKNEDGTRVHSLYIGVDFEVEAQKWQAQQEQDRQESQAQQADTETPPWWEQDGAEPREPHQVKVKMNDGTVQVRGTGALVDEEDIPQERRALRSRTFEEVPCDCQGVSHKSSCPNWVMPI